MALSWGPHRLKWSLCHGCILSMRMLIRKRNDEKKPGTVDGGENS